MTSIPNLAGFAHGRATVADDVLLHYVSGGDGPPLVLLHGWPETWFQWRLIMPELARDRTVIAVDMRGSGDSTKALGGYDKQTLARDVLELMDVLGHERFALAGHDIGGMVAFATAHEQPERVSALSILDVPLPGVGAWEDILRDPRSSHFRFHCMGIAETLVAGRERQYIEWFLTSIAYSPGVLVEEAIAEYTRCMAAPRGIFGGFGYYREFGRDAEVFAELAKTPLPMPLLCLGGELSAGPWLEVLYSGLAADLRTATIPHTGHWVAEENPDETAARLSAFLDDVDPS
jgi:pimeloyl-ACP methyl ester carboxylesterase